MDDLVSRQAVIDVCLKYNGQGYVWTCIMGDIRKLPSAQPEPLTEEEKRLLKKLRSYHSGSYVKILDKLVASAQPEHHGVCMDCVMKNVCRYKTGLGDYGYCSQWKGEEQ